MSWGLVYGDEAYRFAITPATLGLPCNAPGLLNFLSREPLAIAKEMFFTAEPVPAQLAVS